MQIAEVELLGESLTSYNPMPADEFLLTEFSGGFLGTSLRWTPGDYADTHDVYFGDDFDAVNNGTSAMALRRTIHYRAVLCRAQPTTGGSTM
jgi:hypothetical protein